MKRPSILQSEDRVDLTPMIDIVFLLLIYFMVTTQLIQEESDMRLQLPAETAPPEQPDNLPSEQIIDILEDGQVLLNGAPVDAVDSRDMPELSRTLTRLRQADRRMQIDTVVTIQAEDESLHQRSIDVLNACAKAEIRMVSFGAGDDT